LALGAEIVLIPHSKETAAVARVYLAAGQELLAGAISDLEAERPTNAIRLARHLFEYEQELAYVLDRPAVRLEQLYAEDSHRRLELVRLNDGLEMPPKQRAFCEQQIARARASEARRATGQPEDGWKLPSREVRANVLESREPGRLSDYDLLYRGASLLAHPGPFGADTYVEEIAPGRYRIRGDTADPVRAKEAAVLGAVAFLNLLDTVNWLVGAARGADIRAIMDRLKALP
jgi:uncharacterized protein DUF5677